MKAMTFVIVFEQNWPQIELLTPFLSVLKNHFENSSFAKSVEN